MLLNVVSSRKALEIIGNELGSIEIGSEKVSIDECENRIIFRHIVSPCFVPSFNRSTVDGYAVKAADTFGCSESIPCQLNVKGEILMGESTVYEIGEGECMKISTGGKLPDGADSAVMVEYTGNDLDELCLVFKAVSPFENVTKKGDDVKADEVILKKGTSLTEKQVGVLASVGMSEIEVFRKIRVGIISTGDEIVDITENPTDAKVRDVNSYMLCSLMKKLGCAPTRYGIISDEYEKISATLEKAVNENDIILISGGSSAGARDMTAQIISEKGQLFFHGIAVKPGKPTICGKVGGKAVFGLPGHPAAAYFVAKRFVGSLIEKLYCSEGKALTVEGTLTQNISSNHGREEIVSVKYEDGLVTPVFAKSGVISLLLTCDGYIIIDRDCEGLKQGEKVEVYI